MFVDVVSVFPVIVPYIPTLLIAVVADWSIVPEFFNEVESIPSIPIEVEPPVIVIVPVFSDSILCDVRVPLERLSLFWT